MGEQNNHGDTKILFEAITGTIRNTIENLTKTVTETSIKNNEAISDLNEKSLELMNDKGMIAPNLASSLVYLFTPEKKSQFKIIKYLNSTKLNDFLIHGNKPVTL